MKKRFAALVMCALMVLCVLPVTALAADTWDGTTVDTSWYDSSPVATEFTIDTGAELAGLALLVNTGDAFTPGGTRFDFSGVTINLGDDIDLGGHPWTPIGNDIGYFNGTFEGGGHTVSNLAIGTSASPESTLMYIGLFGFTYSSSSIQNLNVETTGIYSSFNSSCVGVLVGEAMGDLTNCTTAGKVTSSGYYSYVGGLTGGSDGDIQNCSAGGDVVCGTDAWAGGLVGRKTTGVLTGCHAAGDVSGDDYVGGLVGGYGAGTLSNCCATGDVTCSGDYAGGFAGYIDKGNVSSCYATGDVTCSGYYAGGFSGYIDSTTGSVSNCYATGNVTVSYVGGTCVGGFTGYTGKALGNCFATGNVKSTGNGDPFTPVYVGGLVGLSEGSISHCFASGNVAGAGYSCIGGLNGYNSNTVTGCYASGSVTSGTGNNSNIGGLTGTNGDVVIYCYARGAVSGTGTNLNKGGLIGDTPVVSMAVYCYYDTRDTGMSVGIGNNPGGFLSDGLAPDKMTGSSASGNMTNLNFTSDWTTKANDSKWYFPQLAVFSGSSNDTIKAASLASVTLTPFKVTFDSSSGSAVSPEYGYYTAVGKPTDPTRDGHFFEGWYTTSGLTTSYDFSKAVTADITLHAKWTALTLSSSASSGAIYSGGRVTLTPSKDGGVWSFDSNYLSRDGNTFTGLKAGASTITYTVDGISVSYQITISPVPTITSSVSNGTIYVGGRVTLTPSIDGGVWSFDSNYFSREGNTFKGLKAGISIITYTVDGVSATYTVTINQTKLPSTGQDATPIYILAALGALALGAGIILGIRKYARG